MSAWRPFNIQNFAIVSHKLQILLHRNSLQQDSLTFLVKQIYTSEQSTKVLL